MRSIDRHHLLELLLESWSDPRCRCLSGAQSLLGAIKAKDELKNLAQRGDQSLLGVIEDVSFTSSSSKCLHKLLASSLLKRCPSMAKDSVMRSS